MFPLLAKEYNPIRAFRAASALQDWHLWNPEVQAVGYRLDTPVSGLGGGSLQPLYISSCGLVGIPRIVSLGHTLLQRGEQEGQRWHVLTKPVPMLLSLAVLLSLWMFIQEQLNGTVLWGMEERWAEVRHLHMSHGGLFFSLSSPWHITTWKTTPK